MSRTEAEYLPPQFLPNPYAFWPVTSAAITLRATHRNGRRTSFNEAKCSCVYQSLVNLTVFEVTNAHEAVVTIEQNSTGRHCVQEVSLNGPDMLALARDSYGSTSLGGRHLPPIPKTAN